MLLIVTSQWDILGECSPGVIRQVPAAEDCPDSVFIEDAVVVCEDLAVLTYPGAPARRAEVAGVAGMVRSLGLPTARIQEPGTLDGGDVLQAGYTGCRPGCTGPRPVAEEGGCHVVPFGGDQVLIAASAQRVRETRRLRHLPERAAAGTVNANGPSWSADRLG
jgi:hypothetical protein